MSTKSVPEQTPEGCRITVATLALNGCLDEMIRQAKAPLKPVDIGEVERCGAIDPKAWGNGNVLTVLVGRLRDGRRFELRSYLDDDSGVVAESSFRFLS